MTTTALIAGLLVALLIPLVLIWRLTETKQQTIHRLRRNGLTWHQVADRIGCHPSPPNGPKQTSPTTSAGSSMRWSTHLDTTEQQQHATI